MKALLNRAQMRTTLRATVMALVVQALRLGATEPTFDHGPVFGFMEENDLFVATDRHYTQGIQLSYFHEDGNLPMGSQWVYDRIPEVGFQSVVGRMGFSVGQSIYTPADIQKTTLQPDDRPYAGWMYLGTILQRRGWSFGHRLTEEDFAVQAGVIGEWALAREAQTWVHEIRGFDTPKGWKYQLHNEPGIRLKYSRAVRAFEFESEGFGVDFSPRVGASLGNVETSARSGAMLRLGFNLPDDLGYQTIDSLSTVSGGKSCSHPLRWGAYVFVGCEGRVVGFNQSLDGSLYHDSHSVQSKPLVGDAVAGFVLVLNWFEVGYTHTFRSPEFEGQTEHDSFGTVFMQARF